MITILDTQCGVWCRTGGSRALPSGLLHPRRRPRKRTPRPFHLPYAVRKGMERLATLKPPRLQPASAGDLSGFSLLFEELKPVTHPYAVFEDGVALPGLTAPEVATYVQAVITST